MVDRLISVPAARSHIDAVVADPILKACMHNVLDGVPAVDAAPVVHGQWIETPSFAPEYECSECGQSYEWWEVSEAHYCPNCGAKMDLEV